MFLTIMAHWKESLGEIADARGKYEDACRWNFHGNHEHPDLQRFLKKHGLPRKKGPLLPVSFAPPRRIKLSCKAHEEAAILRQLTDECERTGQLLKARDCLHDLYMFDPSDAEVLARARAIEARPQFEVQFQAIVNERRRALQATGVLRK